MVNVYDEWAAKNLVTIFGVYDVHVVVACLEDANFVRVGPQSQILPSRNIVSVVISSQCCTSSSTTTASVIQANNAATSREPFCRPSRGIGVADDGM